MGQNAISIIEAVGQEPKRVMYIPCGVRTTIEEKPREYKGVLAPFNLAHRYIEQDYPDKSDSELTQKRWFPKDINIFYNEINIYDNKIAICSLGNHELLGLIIESKEVADSQRAIFEMAWRFCSNNPKAK